MFAERFDALMNIAEVSNSLLGRSINMNPSHIGRLRKGVRALAKKHDYLPAICTYLTKHIEKDYQLNALQKLTGISSRELGSSEDTAKYLEKWLLENEQDLSDTAVKMLSDFSQASADTASAELIPCEPDKPVSFSEFLYGNTGKRCAVEQFFLMLLRDEKLQTLLLFSDENFEWLFEDAAFSAKWAKLFMEVIKKGNKVRIIHTISRNMNEMLEGITKWLPIYMTGAVEPYFYPMLCDGLFQRTMFIAPETAAVLSSSVRQNTDGMLNIFITDKKALDALCIEYERFFLLCRPLMKIYTQNNSLEMYTAITELFASEGDSYYCGSVPPIFSIPEDMIYEISEKTESADVARIWKQSLSLFEKYIQENKLCIVLLDPAAAYTKPKALRLPSVGMSDITDTVYTAEQYRANIEWLRQMERKHKNLSVIFSDRINDNIILYVKEETGVFLIKADPPNTAFAINDRSMVNAFWTCAENRTLF